VSEMVERLAIKIFETVNADPDWFDGYETPDQAQACDDPDLSQQECLELARIALETLREPTKAMISAGYDSGQLEQGTGMPEPVWQAMIDEALK
jgi:hypothetical protein